LYWVPTAEICKSLIIFVLCAKYWQSHCPKKQSNFGLSINDQTSSMIFDIEGTDVTIFSFFQVASTTLLPTLLPTFLASKNSINGL
jgi:hypothetical protein